MGNRVLVLKGSGRTHGNSSTLADQVAAAAKAAGAEIESFDLNDMDIHPCNGCAFCRGTGICVIEDDMQKIEPGLLAADAIVLATPIYWFTYAAQLKACIDRWYAVWNGNKDVFKGKSIGIVLAYGDSDVQSSGTINAIHAFEAMFSYLQADIVGWVHGSLGEVGDAQKHPELMEQAAQLGARLAQAAPAATHTR